MRSLTSDAAVLRALLDAPEKAVRLWTPRGAGSIVSLRPSPDGLALASAEYEGARLEVFVRRLDDTGRRVQVSVEGGDVIGWDSRGGGVYDFSRGAVWFARITRRPALTVGRPERLFEVAGDVSGAPASVRLRMMPDGERIPALEGPPSQGVRILVVRHGLQRLLTTAAAE